MRHDDLPFSPTPGKGTTEGEFFQNIVFHIMTTLRVAMPATVEKWSPPIPGSKPARVDVVPDFKLVRSIDTESEVRADKGEKLIRDSYGLKAVSTRQTYRNKPILYVGAGPGFNIRGPIPKGTTGLYVVLDRCIDGWIDSGGPIDPATADKHDLNDGFFIPVVYHGKNTPAISADVHQLGPDDGSAGLEIATGTDKSIRMFTDGPNATVDAATLIKLGELATEAIAKAESTIAAIDAMLAGGVPVGNDGGANLKATMTAAWNGVKNSIKATKGRVE